MMHFIEMFLFLSVSLFYYEDKIIQYTYYKVGQTGKLLVIQLKPTGQAAVCFTITIRETTAPLTRT